MLSYFRQRNAKNKKKEVNMNKELLKKLLAEFLGTAVLVTFAVGAAIMGGFFGSLVGVGAIGTLIGGALAFGLVIVAMAYSIGGISGCHINPAVTLGFLVSGRMKLKEGLFYMLAQIIGGIFGGLILFVVFQLMGNYNVYGSMPSLLYGSNAYEGLASNLGAAIGAGLIIEVVLTFVFVFTILMVTSKKTGNAKLAGLVIGFTLTLVHLVGIPFTGTSVNPARSLGAAVFGGVDALRQVWLFLVAPMIGAVLAAFAAKAFIGKEKPEATAAPDAPAAAESEEA